MLKLLSIGLLGLVGSVHALAPRTSNLQAQNKDVFTYSVRNAKVKPILFSQLKRTKKIQNGRLKIQQDFKEIPIYGAEIIYHFKDGKLKSTSGRVAPHREVNTTPDISKREIIDIIQREYSSFDVETIRLVIYPTKRENFLAYEVNEVPHLRALRIFIDAHSGEVISVFDQVSFGKGVGVDGVEKEFETSKLNGQYVMSAQKKNVETRTLQGVNCHPIICSFLLPGNLVTSPDNYFKSKAAVDAQFYGEKFKAFLLDKFERKSFDDKNSQILSTVHFSINFVNAFWNGKQMVYGDGDGKTATYLSGALDVVAHEISHAITTSTSNLEYRNEPGALNEAFSDIIATYAEHMLQPTKADYLIGEDVWTPAVKGDALRYMNNPTMAKNNTDHYSERYTGEADNGGVHWNSGIANLAFYLLAEGGKHPRLNSKKMTGIGIDKAAMLFYQTFTERLTSQSKFKDAREEMIKLTQVLGDVKAERAVKDAWSLVGVK